MHVSLSDGASLHVRIAGPADRPPVVFVHGHPISGGMWAPTIRGLSDRYRCIAPDLRGHGRSDAPSPDEARAMTITTFADDLIDVLDAIGERRTCTFVGLSMGGIILFELFRRQPERVAALVLCNTRPNAESEEGRRGRIERAERALVDGARPIADAMIGSVVAPDAEPRVRAEVHALMCETSPTGVAAGAMALASRPDSWATLPTINVPTLVVAGDRDTITPLPLMMEIHHAIPGSRFVCIGGSGHVPPMERPAEFNASLGAYLRQTLG